MPILPPCRESIKGESSTRHGNLRYEIQASKKCASRRSLFFIVLKIASCLMRKRATFLTARYPPTTPHVTPLSLTTGQARAAPMTIYVWTTISVSRNLAPS